MVKANGKEVAAFPNDDSNSPFYVHVSDNPGAVIVNQQLNSSNYKIWSRCMLTALEAKNKLGFIDGSIPRPGARDPEIGAWLRCNSLVVSWLRNSMVPEIAASIMYLGVAARIWADLHERFSQGDLAKVFQLRQKLMKHKQGSMDVSAYYTSLRTIWDEYRDLQPISWCDCGYCRCDGAKKWSDHQSKDCALYFLEGLNSNFIPLRNQLLSAIPFPDVSKIFAMASQEERQRIMDIGSNIEEVPIASELPSAIANAVSGRGRGRFLCSHCGKTSHTVDRCYELHGYPPGFGRSRGKFQPSGERSVNEKYSQRNVNCVDDEFSENNHGSDIEFSDEQCLKFMTFMQNKISGKSSGSAANSSTPSFNPQSHIPSPSFSGSLPRSNSSNNISPPSSEKQTYWEKPTARVDKAIKKKKHASEDQVFGSTPCLRRSLSFSSGSIYETGEGLRDGIEQTGSPHSSSFYPNNESGRHSPRSRTLTPERQTRSNFVNTAMIQNAHSMEKYDCPISGMHSDLSDISCYCSSNVSSKVLDRYIDGEQMDRCETKSTFSTRNQFENGNVVKKPPKFRSFRETKMSQAQLSSKGGCDNGYCNESPRKLAKHVVARLSQSQFQPKTRSKDFDSENPITIEDIYGRNLNGYSNAYNDEHSSNNGTMDWHSEISHGFHHDENSEYFEKESFSGDKDISGENLNAVTDSDVELFKKFKEAEDRAVSLSEELQKENIIQSKGLGVQTLIQTIRSLVEEKANIALEVSAVFEDRIAERALFREKLKLGRTELEALSLRLEEEKNEMRLTLEKELDRRSIEWSLKLEKLQEEEHRLRERVHELAEQNVSLQREVSSSSEKEIETRTKIINSEKQLGDLSTQIKEAREDNHYFQKTLSELQDKYRAVEEERDCIRWKYEEKASESKDMHQAVSRLQRTCNDQERTIEGLQGLCEELGKKISQDNFDFGIAKMQIEHVRLTGVEHGLRKEVESYRADVDSLRRENIDLLNRLKNNGKEGGFLTFKLDQELQSRISCLQNQMLPLLTETSQLGRKLIEYVKSNGGFPLNKGTASGFCLDGHVLIEYEVKLQGLERASENLATSTKTMSSVLQEKSTLMHEICRPVCLDTQTQFLSDESHKCKEQKSENTIKSELKSETLLTCLLREKLYSRELDVEQLQAELAASIRGNDVLKSEVQNALDNFSCINHKMKEVELQMIKKDETINQLQGNLQDCKKELAIIRGILPKISEERDMMWEEVKRYTESNMLLNSEVKALRAKIESLDEDILLKEGQISILKDSLGKPFDLLATPEPEQEPEPTTEFRWTNA